MKAPFNWVDVFKADIVVKTLERYVPGGDVIQVYILRTSDGKLLEGLDGDWNDFNGQFLDENEPTFEIPKFLWELMLEELEPSASASEKQKEHLDDAIKVRDRLLSIVERLPALQEERTTVQGSKSISSIGGSP